MTPPPPTLGDLGSRVIGFIDLIYAVGGTVFLLLLIVVGILYMTSRGDSDKLQEARQRISYVVIGFVLFILSYSIVVFVYRIFDVRGCDEEPITPGFNIMFNQVCE